MPIKNLKTKWDEVKGKKCKDSIHGIEGIATKTTEFLVGEPIICLETLDGLKIASNWFDESQIELCPPKHKSGFKNDE